MMDHPNIERIMARPLWLKDQRWHIPMEWIRGEKLNTVMFHTRTSSIQLTPEMTSRIITGMCEGLLYLHNYDIAHQNINPKNIMFDSENGRSVIIGVFNHKGLGTLRNQSNPQYAAPEMINPFARGEKWSDVWALGKVIYELLVGYEIPKAATHSANIRIGLSENIYREPVARMVAGDPTNRVTMEDVIGDIRAAECKVRVSHSLSGPRTSSMNVLQPSYSHDPLLMQVNDRIRHDLPPGFRLPNPLPHNATVTLNYHRYDHIGRRIDITGELRTRNGRVHDVWWTVCKPDDDPREDESFRQFGALSALEY